MAGGEIVGYINFLRESAERTKSIVCFGLDPVLEKIPIEEADPEKKISKFYYDIFDALESEGVFPGAFKPNIAFYEQYGFEGLRALQKIIHKVREMKIPLIIDAKRGDIGKTNVANAKALFDFWQADAITVSPFLGKDAVDAFLKYCRDDGKGVYLLNRTTNKGAADFQNLDVGGKPLYLKVSGKIAEWGEDCYGNLGAVVGATSLEELEEISKFFSGRAEAVPFLIPGVGAQGGSAGKVSKILKETHNEHKIHRINSSSGISYAYEKAETDDFAGAAVNEIKKLNHEINL